MPLALFLSDDHEESALHQVFQARRDRVALHAPLSSYTRSVEPFDSIGNAVAYCCAKSEGEDSKVQSG